MLHSNHSAQVPESLVDTGDLLAVDRLAGAMLLVASTTDRTRTATGEGILTAPM
jgi:hypothetical protein